jgi:hypothetical protein
MPRRVDQDLAVKAAEALPATVNRELLTVLRAVPVLIHGNGLVMAVTYLLAKAKGNSGDRHWTVAQAILGEAADLIRLNLDTDDPLTILDALATVDSARYAVAQRRARELAVWLGRIGSARATGEGR